MPISLWMQWKAWLKWKGPPAGLGDDLRMAMLALQVATPNIRPEDREVRNFLPPHRKASDYRRWLYVGEDVDEGPLEFEIE